MKRFAFGGVVALLALVACDASFGDDNDVDVVDPSDPTKHVSVSKSTLQLCDVMCDALIQDYAVPTTEKDACVFQCADGFAATPDACYELVSCVHDANICANGDVSPDCRARAGPCLSHWAIPNGLCLGCWKPSVDLVGTRAISDTDSTGTHVVPVDLQGRTVVAQFPGRSAFIPFPGTGTSDGHFTVPGIPSCPTWLEVDTRFFWATSATPNFVDDAIGRTSVATAGPGTSLVVDFTGFDPNAAGYLELDVPGIASQNGALVPVTLPMQTTPNGSATADWTGNALVDGNAGDVLYALQFTKPLPTATANVLYRHVAQVGKAAPFTMQNGQTTHSTLALAPVAATEKATLDYRLEDFYAALPDAKTSTMPQGPFGEFFLYVDTAFSGGKGGTTANLAYVPSLRGIDAPITLGELVYPTLGPGFYVNVDALIQVPRPAEADGIQQSGNADVVIVSGDVALMKNGPVRPTIGLVRDLRVNGTPVSMTNDTDSKAVLASGFGLTPTVTWQPPSIGAPSQYDVLFTSFEATPSQVQLRTIEPSVRVPPGALKAGVAYTVQINARGVDPSGRSGISSLNSGVIRP